MTFVKHLFDQCRLCYPLSVDVYLGPIHLPAANVTPTLPSVRVGVKLWSSTATRVPKFLLGGAWVRELSAHSILEITKD